MKFVLLAAAGAAGIYVIAQLAIAVYEGEKMLRMVRQYGYRARHMKGWPK